MDCDGFNRDSESPVDIGPVVGNVGDCGPISGIFLQRRAEMISRMEVPMPMMEVPRPMR